MPGRSGPGSGRAPAGRPRRLSSSSWARLREIHETSIRELAEGLSPDLKDELARFSLPFDDKAPTEAELRIGGSGWVGW